VRVPGDKSISHRALLFGAIAEGETRIEGLLPAEDPLSTAACLRAMGVTVSEIRAGEPVTVQGVGLDGFAEPGDVLDCGNSGTTMRLMLGLLAGRVGRHFVLTGDGSRRGRPMRRVGAPLAQMGAVIHGRKEGNFAPLAVQGQALVGTTIRTPVASAQVRVAVSTRSMIGSEPRQVFTADDGTFAVAGWFRTDDSSCVILGGKGGCGARGACGAAATCGATGSDEVKPGTGNPREAHAMLAKAPAKRTMVSTAKRRLLMTKSPQFVPH
jgi:3-phosphoshikimate 1-carboxyvinyltransferase